MLHHLIRANLHQEAWKVPVERVAGAPMKPGFLVEEFDSALREHFDHFASDEEGVIGVVWVENRQRDSRISTDVAVPAMRSGPRGENVFSVIPNPDRGSVGGTIRHDGRKMGE